jgi:hypothetical protein
MIVVRNPSLIFSAVLLLVCAGTANASGFPASPHKVVQPPERDYSNEEGEWYEYGPWQQHGAYDRRRVTRVSVIFDPWESPHDHGMVISRHFDHWEYRFSQNAGMRGGNSSNNQRPPSSGSGAGMRGGGSSSSRP